MSKTITTTKSLAYLAGVDMAKSHDPDFRDAPLSGEWAGESMPEIAYAYGLDEDDEFWPDEFEAGYYEFATR